MAQRIRNSTGLFSDRVKEYLRYRPGYPAEMIEYLIWDEQLEALFDNQSYQQITYPYLQSFDFDQLLGRMQSSSYTPAKPGRELSELGRSAVTCSKNLLRIAGLSFSTAAIYTWAVRPLIHKPDF